MEKTFIQFIKEAKLIKETLTKNDSIEVWIRDFIDSNDKRFEGKSKEERIEMAKGAYYGATKGE